MRVAIIGAGSQCRRRAPVVREWPGSELACIASHRFEDAKSMASQFGCEPVATWIDAVTRRDVDIVLVCTPPYAHAEICVMALREGKHVLCEKPMCRTEAEAEEMVRVALETGRILKCGFNLRHHPAISEAKRIVIEGGIGRVMFARCKHGTGWVKANENGWRSDPNRAAGGWFIEHGIHAIDLFRWFMGDVAEVGCMTGSQYNQDRSLDDNGMALFRMQSGAIASLHTSMTQWKPVFNLEIFGDEGYVIVDGLGTCYGTEKLVFGKRDFKGPPSHQVTEYREDDLSWRDEWKEFMLAIEEIREPVGNGEDGLASIRIALKAYEAERLGRTLPM